MISRPHSISSVVSLSKVYFNCSEQRRHVQMFSFTVDLQNKNITEERVWFLLPAAAATCACFPAPETGSATSVTRGKHRKYNLHASNSTVFSSVGAAARHGERQRTMSGTHSFAKKTQTFKLEGWSYTDGQTRTKGQLSCHEKKERQSLSNIRISHISRNSRSRNVTII